MNKNDEKKTDKSTGQYQRAIEYLSPSIIGKKTAWKVVQHPTVLFPIAICTIVVIYLLLLSLIFGGKLWAIILATISAIIASWSFYSRYSEEYPKMVQEHVNFLKSEQAQMEGAELSHLCQTLEAGFASIASSKGMEALAGLSSEYKQLKISLNQPRITDSLSTPLIQSLAGETYRRGLAVLSDALELIIVSRTPGRERVERDILELERDIIGLEGDESLGERLLITKETLASHRRRLHMLDEIEVCIDRLLYEARRCESALNIARIELAAARASSSKTGVDTVTEALQRTIHQVKEVQDELSKLGY